MSHIMVVNVLGRTEGVESQTPENVVSHGECPRASLPNAHPANTVSLEHHASLQVWAAIVSTTSSGTGEPEVGQGWRKGKQSQDVILCDSLWIGTRGGERVSFSRPSFHTPAVLPLPPPPSPSHPIPAREKDCNKELKQENTYWSFISDAINQIHNPENIRVGTSKEANCVRDSYSEQRNLPWGPASGWLCRASSAEATTSLRDISPDGTHLLNKKSCCFPLKW